MSAVPTIPPEEGAIPELLLSSDTKYQNDPPITALLFMIDASKSVNEICSPEEQALTYQVPGMMISLFKSLSSYAESMNEAQNAKRDDPNRCAKKRVEPPRWRVIFGIL
jgi:hypothetical protein